MMHKVEVSPEVLSQIEAQARYYRSEEVSESTIIDWMLGLYDRFTNLKDHPKRFPVDEARTLNKGYEIRRLNYGDFGVFYRAYDEQPLVEILDLRHGRRLPNNEQE
jgi:plasmid stabilization system protein ParE